MRFALLVFLLAGCLDGDQINLSKLSPAHQIIVAEAAELEGVEVVEHRDPWVWMVSYDHDLETVGYADWDEFYGQRYGCKITFNPQSFDSCGPERADAKLKWIALHEIDHCKGYNHSSGIMAPTIDCADLD